MGTKRAGRNEGSVRGAAVMLLLIALILATLLMAVSAVMGQDAKGKEIIIKLEYNTGTVHDADDNGVESYKTGNVSTATIDFTVNGSEFTQQMNQSNLCARWKVYSVENETAQYTCYGSKSCCGFLELPTESEQWNDAFNLTFGAYGSAKNNTVSAQISYIFSNETSHYSNVSSLPAMFITPVEPPTGPGPGEQPVLPANNVPVCSVPNQTIQKNSTVSLNLSYYCTDADGDKLLFSSASNESLLVIIVTTAEGSTATLTPAPEFIGQIEVAFTANDSVNASQPNQVNITVVEKAEAVGNGSTATNVSVTEVLVQHIAEVGKPVRWTKKLLLTGSSNASTKIPKEAKNIVVKKGNDTGIGSRVKVIQGGSAKTLKEHEGVLVSATASAQTISPAPPAEDITVVFEENATEYEIEYFTPAPETIENDIEKGRRLKQIVVSSEVHYYSVKASTNFPETAGRPGLYHIVNGSRADITGNSDYKVTFLDANGNGLYDKVEWVVPQLSEQVFEIGLATVNTRKSVYHPGETSEIVIVVLDDKGRLVGNADVTLTVTRPDNLTAVLSTASGTVAETERGIYETNYSETGLEGNYTLIVAAAGNNVNDTMTSYFTVRQYYEFDILRTTPVTTDPWKAPFSSSIKVVSLTNAATFDFTETLPGNFTITDSGGAAVTEQSGFKLLYWKNLENNSVVSYLAKPPLKTPELYELGPAKVEYNSNGVSATYTEARPWYLAVDPAGSGKRQQKTVEYFIFMNWSQNTGTAATTPFRNESLINVYIPETNPALKSAWVDLYFGKSGAGVTATVVGGNSGLSVNGSHTWAFGRSGTDTREYLLMNYLANVTSRLAALGFNTGPNTYNFSFNITLTNVGGVINAPNAKLYLTYEYDGNSEEQLETVRRFVGTDNTTNNIAAVAGREQSLNFSFTNVSKGLPSSAVIRDAWVELYGVVGADTTTDARINVSLDNEAQGGGGTDLIDIGSGGPAPFRLLFRPSSFNPNLPHTLNISISGGANNLSGVSAELVMTYSFNSILDNGRLETMRYFIAQNDSSFTAAGATGEQGTTVLLPQKSVTVQDAYVVVTGHLGVATSGATDGARRVRTAVSRPGVNNDAARHGATLRHSAADGTQNIMSFRLLYNSSSLVGLANGDVVNCTVGVDGSGMSSPGCELVVTFNYSYQESATLAKTVGFFAGSSGAAAGFTGPIAAAVTNLTSNFSVTYPAEEGTITMLSPYVWVTNPNVGTTADGSVFNQSLSMSESGKQGLVINNPDIEQFLAWGLYNVTGLLNTSQTTFVLNLTSPLASTYNAWAFVTYSYDIDKEPPNVTIITPVANTVVGGPVGIFVNASVNDSSTPVTGVNVSIYNSTGNVTGLMPMSLGAGTELSGWWNATISTSALIDGYYNVSVNATDNYSNTRISVNVSVIVDNTPPNLTYISPTPQNRTFRNTSALVVNVTHNETNAGFVSLLINGSVNQTTQYNSGDNDFTNFTARLDDGIYNFSIFINDSVGNSNTLPNITIIVDTTAPLIFFTAPTPINNTNQSQISFVVNVTYNDTYLNTTVLYINGTVNQTANYTGNFTNFTVSGLNEGVYLYYATINDTAGNVNRTEERLIRIDLTAPVLNIEEPNPVNYTNNPLVNFTYNTTDNIAGVKNCSLLINSQLNQTDTTIQQGASQNFTLALENGTYSWRIQCLDFPDNLNVSEVRNVTVDTTSPQVSTEAVNMTLVNVTRRVCINATVTDTFSNISKVTAQVKKPESGLVNFTLANTSSCGNAGGAVYAREFLNDEAGNYTWNRTFAFDRAGNVNQSTPQNQVNWSAVSSIFLNTTMPQPTTNLTINESQENINYSFDQRCNTVCREDSTGSCDGVFLKPQLNNGTWRDVTNVSGQLLSNVSWLFCGTLTPNTACNASFQIRTALASGPNTFPVRCFANSTTAAVDFSIAMNVTVNDPPVAAFTRPNDRENISGNYTLNASASTDDRGISNYSFELDDNSGFSSPTTLCSSAGSTCVLNTTGQTQCQAESFNCYIRLNVTDRDESQNSTTIQIQIDNTKPVVRLNSPANNSYLPTAAASFNYTPFDTNIGYCTLYHNSSGWAANETNTNVRNDTSANFTITLSDNVYLWNVGCNDTATNVGFNLTNFTLTVDTTTPTVALNEPANNTLTLTNSMPFNFTPVDQYLQNCSLYANFSGSFGLNLTNSTTLTTGAKNTLQPPKINDGTYVWNIKCYDKAGNSAYNNTNYTVRIDATAPGQFNLSLPANNTQSANVSPTFEWNQTSEQHFTNYTFRIDNDSDISSPYITSYVFNITNTSFSMDLPANLSNNSKYYWLITAYDNLSQAANSSQIFTYVTDNITPQTYLMTPVVNYSETSTNIISFMYNVTEVNDAANCSLILNSQAVQTQTMPQKETPQTFARSVLNGGYNWSVNCADAAGNMNGSEVRNLSVQVPVPRQPFDIVAYNVSTGSGGFPKYRNYVTAFDEEAGANDSESAATTWLVIKSNPVRDEFLMGALDETGDVTIQAYNSTSWRMQGELTQGISAVEDDFKGFDIAFEQLTGRGMVVYNTGIAGLENYSIWNGTAWEINSTLPADSCLGTPRWIRLDSKPNSNNVAMMYFDSAADYCAAIWNGSAWINSTLLQATAIATTTERFDIAYEALSGDILTAWESPTAGIINYCEYNASNFSWCAGPTSLADRGTANTWIQLASDPSSNRIMMGTFQTAANNDFETLEWSGTAFGTFTSNDLNAEPGDRVFDVAYIGTTGNALAVWASTANDFTNYSTCTGEDCFTGTWVIGKNTTLTTDNCGEAANLEFVKLDADPYTRNVMMTAHSQTSHFVCAQEYNGNGGSWRAWNSGLGSAGTAFVAGEQKMFHYNRFNDTKPPLISFIQPPTPSNNSFVNTSTVLVNVSVEDTYDVFNCRLEWQGVNETMSLSKTSSVTYCYVTKTGLADGNYSFRVYANDTSANINQTELRNITIDLTLPSLALNISPNPANFSFNNVTVNWSATDLYMHTNFTNITYPNGTVLGTFTAGFSLNATTNLTVPGNYTVTVFANDTAGNVNTKAEGLFVNDTVAPIVSLNAPPNNTYNNTNAVRLYYTPSDNYNVTNCTLIMNGQVNRTNDTIAQAIQNNVSLSFNEGNYTWRVNCSDTFNNINVSETWLFTVDVSPPNITYGLVTDVNNSNTTNDWVFVNVTANDTHEANITFYLFNSTGLANETTLQLGNKTGNRSINFTNLPGDGAHFFNATIRDRALNQNTTEPRLITIVRGPDFVNVSLASDNRSAALNWTNKTYADYFDVYISLSHNASFQTVPNASLIKDRNWTDPNASQTELRFYRVASVRSNANKTTNFTVGKHTVFLAPSWNMAAFPLTLLRFGLKNSTHPDGYDLAVSPPGCVGEIWRYNVSLADPWELVTYESGQWVPATGDANFTALEPGRGYWLFNNLSQTCNLTFTGAVPTGNISKFLNSGFNLQGWYSEDNPSLPTSCQPPYPVEVSQPNSVTTLYYYNTTTTTFKGTMHFTSASCGANNDWGWWPDTRSKEFTSLNPSRSYYAKTSRITNWTLQSSK